MLYTGKKPYLPQEEIAQEPLSEDPFSEEPPANVIRHGNIKKLKKYKRKRRRQR